MQRRRRAMTMALLAEREVPAAEYRREPEGRLTVSERASKRVLFTAQVPPLRYLWISPDHKLVVGLGEGKKWDDQADGVLVYTREGKLLVEEVLDPVGHEHPLHNEGQYAPQVYLTVKDGVTTLVVEDRTGGMHAFDLPVDKT